MALTLVTPPPSPPSLAEQLVESVLTGTVLDHLSVNAEAPDYFYIYGLTEAAVALLDGPNGKLNRCLLDQSWKLTLDHCFPPIIELSVPPLNAVNSVKYCDPDGVLQTLDSGAYRVTGAGSWLTEIAPTYGTCWPAVRDQLATVEVTFTSGYGVEADNVPSPILQAIRMLVAHWYENRAAVERTQFAEVPLAVQTLLAPYRVFR